ncbi:MAG: TIGR04076 family protein [Candidatus Bathyarchaeota archaeon]|nr:TIGR04076 family protein [Candidatus Bathyarchaeota archaeon]
MKDPKTKKKRYRVKITVVRTTKTSEFWGDKLPVTAEMDDQCSIFREGQEFVIEAFRPKVPQGFCSWAWRDLLQIITALRCGADFPWTKEEATSLHCCTDGWRPVFFRLERIEDC